MKSNLVKYNVSQSGGDVQETFYLQNLVQLLSIFHHNDVSFAVISNVVACFWRVCGIDSSHYPSGVHREQIRICPFVNFSLNVYLNHL